MFEALATAVDEIDIGADPDALAAVLALRDRLDARISAAVAAVDAAALWEIDGATSMTAWLADRGRTTRRRAARATREARLVARLPHTGAAWAGGTLSSGQVEAICANLDGDLVDLFARHEAAVLPDLAPLPATDVATAMATWRACADDRPPAPDPPQRLHAARLLDGRLAVDGTLGAETGELLLTALRLARTDDVEGEPARTGATRRADALGDICRFFLDHQREHRGGRHRPHINLVVELDRHGDIGAARTLGGTPVDRVSAGRLLCDSVLHRVVVGSGSAILDYGRAIRAVPPPLWNVTVLRDRHCRFPGCDRPPGWCEAHHVRPWEKGGVTAPGNLVLLCSRHHHLVHRPGWRAELLADATLRVTDPRGRVRTTRAPVATGPPGDVPLPLAG
ncbi:MAG TPA: DUF222 domain-containing protein [Acidimicrobiales bacterium]|nr:DUF222 domain-containing protein [Acidimicrobiales bacterium]